MKRIFAHPLAPALLTAFFLRLAWVLYTPALPTSDFASYNHQAHSLLQGVALSSAYRVPGYPYFLAGLYALFGDHLLAPKLANVLLGTLGCFFIYRIAQLTFNEKIGLIATWLVALLPSHILYTGLLATETLYTCLLLGSTALFLSAVRNSKIRLMELGAAGLLLGLSALVRPTSLLIPGVWGFYLLARRSTILRLLGVPLAGGLLMLLVFSPWLWLNYQQTGRLVVQTNGGLNWYLGFNPQADGYYSREVLQAFLAEARQLELDEFQTDRLAYQRAFAYIRAHPLRSLALTPLKWFHLFKHDVSGVVWNFMEPSRPYSRLVWYGLVFVGQGFYLLLMGFCVVGLLACFKHPMAFPGWSLPLGMLLLWLAYHGMTIGVDRFHIPLLPFLAAFSGVGILELQSWFTRRWFAPDQDTRYTWKDDPFSSHRLALAWLETRAASGRILDVGCAGGQLGAHLKRPPELLTGIEPNPAWAQAARTWYGCVINTPLGAVPDGDLQGYQDVLLLDVLEHLPDPQSQLARLKDGLPPEGRLLISVPNVAHLYVRLKLLGGQFDYAERGILDRAHLRFFTRRSFLELLSTCGLRPLSIQATPIPLPLVSTFFSSTAFGRGLHRLSAWAARLWPTLLAYQFVVVAAPDEV